MVDNRNLTELHLALQTVGLHSIVLASPGGLTGGGGMGSVTRVMKQWMEESTPGITVDVVDPRGEGHAFWSLFYGPYAAARLIYCRLWKSSGLLHLQASERSSFVRKGALLFIARAFKMRVVLHHHGAELIPFFRDASPRMKRLVRWSVRTADVNIVLGQIWKDFLVTEVGVSEKQVVVSVNATKDIRPEVPPANRDPWHFLALANLSPRKGIGELLEAIARLHQQGVPIKLTLAGGGEVDRYKQQAKQLDIEACCTFTGWIQGDAVTQLLLTRSALVLPSYHEGLPMTIIEALSVGLPVVTTPVGSIPDHLENDVSCIFVSPGSVTEISNALKRLATDSELRSRLTGNGRILYEQRFDLQGYMLRMLALYEKVQSAAYVQYRSNDTGN
jgi:glycosyltransferase involved in cell wall biosynthesis